MQEVPTIRSIMTPAPRVVDSMEDTRTAAALMTQYGIRHLPVLQHGKLFGVLSERDAQIVLAHVSTPLAPPVLAVCARDPYAVGPETSIEDAALDMANRRLDAGLVVEGERLLGIFTTVDVCRALSRLIAELR